MSKANRNQIINKLREEGFTIGQLERITGISRGIITRAKNVQKQARPYLHGDYSSNDNAFYDDLLQFELDNPNDDMYILRHGNMIVGEN